MGNTLIYHLITYSKWRNDVELCFVKMANEKLCGIDIWWLECHQFKHIDEAVAPADAYLRHWFLYQTIKHFFDIV